MVTRRISPRRFVQQHITYKFESYPRDSLNSLVVERVLQNHISDLDSDTIQIPVMMDEALVRFQLQQLKPFYRVMSEETQSYADDSLSYR